MSMRDSVHGWLHCRLCIAQRVQGSRIEVGAGPKGIYVGCLDHGLIANIDEALFHHLTQLKCDLCAQGKEHVH